MADFYDVQIAEAEAAQSTLAEHNRLAELASGLDDLRERKRRADELSALWAKLAATRDEMRGYVAESAQLIPAWRERFASAHAALLAVAAEVDTVQAPLLLAGDALHRLYRLERTIQGLSGQPQNSTVQAMWRDCGGNHPDLDPLKGLADPGLPGWFYAKGHKFLYRPQHGVKHFFRG